MKKKLQLFIMLFFQHRIAIYEVKTKYRSSNKEVVRYIHHNHVYRVGQKVIL